ncbi:rhodanese-like domain-containing protein [Micromonospora arborensis]|uniref:rhodanese-like domain-containing protein n=1 Tax=Micromonospora arborensis TaxID=2116518 RepID=UPI003412300A
MTHRYTAHCRICPHGGDRRSPPADPATAAAHFSARLSVETDVSDVHADLSARTPNLVVVDSRGAAAWAQGHLPGAVHLPTAEIARRVRVLGAGGAAGGDGGRVDPAPGRRPDRARHDDHLRLLIPERKRRGLSRRARRRASRHVGAACPARGCRPRRV